MSLDRKPKGNPNWVKGQSGNPSGRPKGSTGGRWTKNILKVAATLSGVNRNPVEELIRIADNAETASSHVVITKSGCTSWKIGEIVPKIDFVSICAKVTKGEMPEAKSLPGGDKDLAAKIWLDLLRYCEPQKKAQEVPPEKPLTPEESRERAEETYRALQELENGTNSSTISGDKSSLGTRATGLPVETSTEAHLQSDQGEQGTNIRS